MTLLECMLPFDRIVFHADASERELGVEDFMALSLQERMKMILERRVCFYQEDKEILPMNALRALYDARRPLGA